MKKYIYTILIVVDSTVVFSAGVVVVYTGSPSVDIVVVWEIGVVGSVSTGVYKVTSLVVVSVTFLVVVVSPISAVVVSGS